MKHTLIILSILLLTISCKQKPRHLNADLPIEERVDALLGIMNNKEKVGQVVMGERGAIFTGAIKKLHLGAMLTIEGQKKFPQSVDEWRAEFKKYQQEALSSKLAIPMLIGIDAVHGHAYAHNAVIFPHNIGLGATRNPDLIEEIGSITGIELNTTAQNWNFSPCLAVSRDERWGRTYESFGENPDLQNLYAGRYVKGLQGQHVIACAKHFVGDGGAEWGRGEKSMIDRGDITTLSLDELKKIHAPGYIAAIKENVGSIMASYNLFKGKHMHNYKELITDYLKAPIDKQGLGFKGFVSGDYDAITHISELNGSYEDKLIKAFNIGIDMPMEGKRWMDVYQMLIRGVESGKISQQRLDDAVRRILRVKFQIGLFEDPFRYNQGPKKVGAEKHKKIAQQAVKESLVLLKNKNNVLPLKKNAKVFVSGPLANNLGAQCGGWSVKWQGVSDPIDTKRIIGTTILDGIQAQLKKNGGTCITDKKKAQQADVAIVIVGELPYSEWHGDINKKGNMDLFDKNTTAFGNHESLEYAKKLGVPVVVIIISGRPLIITNQITNWNACIAAWLPGSEGGAIADVLFGYEDFKGKLAVTWPRSIKQLPINIGDKGYGVGDRKPLFEYGYGLTMK